MAIVKQTVRYEVGGVAFESLAVWDDGLSGPRPAVVIAPTFMDRSAFEDGKAEKLAALGYVGFAIDLFGVDVQPANFEEAGAAMTVLNADRHAVAARMLAAVEQVRALDVTDRARVAAIGFCFGGKCALDLAQRHSIHLHPLLAHQAQQMGVGTRLLGKAHDIKLLQL